MKPITIPTHCPECSSLLVLINEQLFCKNSACPAQINGKLVHFAKTLGIKGLGEKTVEKLEMETLLDIYFLDEGMLSSLIGEKLAVKLVNEIEKSKDSDFATVLSALSIPLIGNTASKKLAEFVNSFSEITQETCKEAGLGEKATNNLLNWLSTEYLELKDYFPFEFKQEKKPQKEVIGTICITGKLTSFKNKADATLRLEQMGYKVVDTLTKEVSILVDESGKGSSKRKTAEERGLTIITDLNQFIK